MFRMKVSDVKTFKGVMDAISVVVDEPTFHVDPSGVRLRAMDPSRVAMVDWSMQGSSFDGYEADGETKMCVSLGELRKILKRAGGGDSVELSMEEGSLKVKISGRYTRVFTLPVLEAGSEEPPELSMAFDAKIMMDVEDLYSVLADAGLADDFITIEADGERLTVRSKGSTAGSVIELEKGSGAIISMEVSSPSKASYSLSYLSDIVKAASEASDVVVLEFSTDKPIRLDFRQRYEGKLAYLVAPRVEEE